MFKDHLLLGVNFMFVSAMLTDLMLEDSCEPASPHVCGRRQTQTSLPVVSLHWSWLQSGREGDKPQFLHQ